MWAVEENFVAAMEFGISGFHSSGGNWHLHTYFAQVGPRPLKLFQGGGGGGGGGGGAIRPKRLGPSLRQISILKS